MKALEKLLVNRPSHTHTVADRALQLLSRIDSRSGWWYLDVGCGVGMAAREIAASSEMSVAGATHHIPDSERAFAEMVRVLAKGRLSGLPRFRPSWLAKAARPLIRCMGFPSASALHFVAAGAGLANFRRRVSSLTQT